MIFLKSKNIPFNHSEALYDKQKLKVNKKKILHFLNDLNIAKDRNIKFNTTKK